MNGENITVDPVKDVYETGDVITITRKRGIDLGNLRAVQVGVVLLGLGGHLLGFSLSGVHLVVEGQGGGWIPPGA